MSYVDQVLFGDATGINAGCDTGRLARYFQALARTTARLADDKMLFAAAISRLTERLRLPPVGPAGGGHAAGLDSSHPPVDAGRSSSKRLKRLVCASKRYVFGPSLVAGALRLDVNGVLCDGDVLGRILETFVVAHLRAELAIVLGPPHPPPPVPGTASPRGRRGDKVRVPPSSATPLVRPLSLWIAVHVNRYPQPTLRRSTRHCILRRNLFRTAAPYFLPVLNCAGRLSLTTAWWSLTGNGGDPDGTSAPPGSVEHPPVGAVRPTSMR